MWTELLLNVESGSFDHPVNRCTVMDSWKNPLVDKHENSINPCFLSTIYTIVFVSFLVLTNFQIIRTLWYNGFGLHKIKYSFGSTFSVKSVGILNLLKFNALFIQCLLSLAILSFNFNSFYDVKSLGLVFSSLALIFGALPLHLIEPTRLLVPAASLLFFWLFNVLISFINLLQDTFSSYKIYIIEADKSIQVAIHVIEILLFLNSFIIFGLEAWFYKPSVELVDYYNLNEWDITRVRSVFNRFSFKYFKRTVDLAIEEENLSVEDLPSTLIDCHNEVAYTRFLKFWNSSFTSWKTKQEKLLAKARKTGKPIKKTTPSLFLPVFRLILPFFLRALFFNLLEFAAQIFQPYLLRYFLLFATNRYMRFKSNGDEDIEKQPIVVGFSIATCIYFLGFLRFVCFNRVYVNTQTGGNVINTSLSSHIYNKGMKLSPKERKNKTIGELINNLAQDIGTLQNSPDFICSIVTQPLTLVVYIYTIYNFLGIAALAGLTSALILIPFASACFTFVYKQMKLQMKYKDERSKLMNEVLTSIKSIKLYSWEKPMLERISEVRNDKELKALKTIGIIETLITFIWDTIPFTIAVSTFATATYLGNVTLTPDVVFPALTIFGLIQEPILEFPNIFQNIAESKVSLERLSTLFVMEELEVKELQRSFEPLKKGDESIIVKNATFVWTKESEEEKKLKQDSSSTKKTDDEENEIESTEDEINPVALTDINFTAKKGELSCVVGRVGSGKSTLLKSILGCIPIDTEVSEPVLKVTGSIAYCAQNVWILNSTVRENILFGRKFDKAFYDTTIEACQLTKDFDVLPDGDITVVGEKGISLSGGQKARISLARAVYSRAEIYVLDDILSAVDTHVGKKIIKGVLSKDGMLSSKTIILATNSVPVLHEADNIILLEQGKITERGTFDEVMAAGSHLAKLITEFGKQGEKDEEAEQEEETKIPDDKSDVKSVSNSVKDSSSENENSIQKYQPDEEAGLNLTRVETNVTLAPSFVSFGHSYEEDFKDDPTLVKKTGHSEEIQNRGRVNLSIYKHYVKACGYFNIFIYLSFAILSTVFTLSNSYVLKEWSEENAKYGTNVKVGFFLTLYSLIAFASLVVTMISSLVLFCFVAINGSKFFHDNMAQSVLRSPMSFFETTPIGRILNRFTEDINIIDNHIAWVLTFFVSFMFRAVSVFGVVFYNLPFMVPVIFVLLFAYNHFRQMFMPASRELKRLRSAYKSPVFSHTQESLAGVDTIMAYNQLDRFQHRSSANLDKFIKIDQCNLAANRWLSMRLQGLSSFVVYCSTLLILLSLVSSNPIGPGLVGFMMTYILDVTLTINAIIRQYAEIETRSITVERLLEYINLKPEAEMIIEENRPDASWPQEGAISFKNYETKYRENLDPVLKDIAIDIKPAEKIGIVGRTGAGKSSLTLALFRIIEATGGHIEIDGVDTSKMGLFDLRSKLNIIPQDSQAIDGSIRENLDPFGKHSDEDLWRVLELSHLKSHVENMKTEDKADDDEDESTKANKADKKIATGLDARIEEGGGNLSAGQKQLMCLARALLNESRVLILDEATASVDVQTDKIVQDTIRSEFKDKTILTIAHRIETIMDSDRVLVLDKGTVKEFASPEELLKNKEGIFYLLCKEGGHI